MFVPLAGKELLSQLLAEIPVIVKYPHDAVLDDVRHMRSVLFDFLPISSEKQEMLHLLGCFYYFFLKNFGLFGNFPYLCGKAGAIEAPRRGELVFAVPYLAEDLLNEMKE